MFVYRGKIMVLLDNIQHPKDGVVKNFTKRQHYNFTLNNVKTIVRSKHLLSFTVHMHICNKQSHQITTDNKYSIKTDNHLLLPISENILKESNLHINHYQIQSVEFFQKIKMTRGDVTENKKNNMRDMNYFKRHDDNELLDDELSIIQSKIMT